MEREPRVDPERLAQRVLAVMRDALAPFARGERRERILRTALEMARVDRVPVQGPELRQFVEHHLTDAIEAGLGVDAAEAFEDSVERVLHAVALEYERLVQTASSAIGTLVLVASTDPARIGGLEEVLAKRTNVQGVDDPLVLGAILQAGLVSAVVIDCANLPLDAETVRELAHSLGEGRLLLWGAPEEVEAAFEGRTVIGCAAGAGIRHVAALCLALIDDLARA